MDSDKNNIKYYDLAKYFTLVSVIIGGFGVIITTVHLDFYNLPFSETLSPRVFYVGFIFSLWVIGSLIIYAMFFDYDDFLNNKPWRILYLTIIKAVIITHLLIILVVGANSSYHILGRDNSALSAFTSLIASSPNIIIIVLVFGYQDLKYSTDRFTLIVWKIPLIISIVFSFIFVGICVTKTTAAKDILIFEAYVGLLFFSFFGSAVLNSRDREKGIKIYPDTFFSNSEKRNFLDSGFLYLYIVIVLLILIGSYSSKIYSHLQRSYGGGKGEQKSIILSNDTIKGVIITHTDQYIFLEKDSTIYKLDWDDVKALKK